MRQRWYDWLNDWTENRQTERLGQAFINDFIRSNWIELYNETDTVVALKSIIDWLTEHCYCDEHGYYMPEKADVYKSDGRDVGRGIR